MLLEEWQKLNRACGFVVFCLLQPRPYRHLRRASTGRLWAVPTCVQAALAWAHLPRRSLSLGIPVEESSLQILGFGGWDWQLWRSLNSNLLSLQAAVAGLLHGHKQMVARGEIAIFEVAMRSSLGHLCYTKDNDGAASG